MWASSGVLTNVILNGTSKLTRTAATKQKMRRSGKLRFIIEHSVITYIILYLLLFQGALDGGLDIPHGDKRFVGYDTEGKKLDPEQLKKYIMGGHVSTCFPIVSPCHAYIFWDYMQCAAFLTASSG